MDSQRAPTPLCEHVESMFGSVVFPDLLETMNSVRTMSRRFALRDFRRVGRVEDPQSGPTRLPLKRPG